jgi:hypothetical protein
LLPTDAPSEDTGILVNAEMADERKKTIEALEKK